MHISTHIPSDVSGILNKFMKHLISLDTGTYLFNILLIMC